LNANQDDTRAEQIGREDPVADHHPAGDEDSATRSASKATRRGTKKRVHESAATTRERRSRRDHGTSLAPEIVAFCARERIGKELDKAIQLAKKHFVVSTDPTVQLEQDPELDDFHLVVEVSTSGEVRDIVAAHQHFAQEWAAAVPWPKSEKIRLTYDIV
jgi:hypothetical protein